MALNLKNSEVEKLATEVAALARESKTEAIRVALMERRARLLLESRTGSREERMDRLLKNRIWPNIPAELLGTTISKREEEEILGFGSDGF
jgi:antitoxin VapB